MRFQTSQQMKLGQSMKMAPRMIQSMEILQMPLAELCERIEQELESNPTIELAEIEPTPSTDVGEDGSVGTDRELVIEPEGASDFARLDEYTNANPDAAENTYADSKMTRDYEDLPRSRVSSGERDGKMDAMASAPARAASLTDQLLDQWTLTDVDDRIRAIGEVLIQNLDEDGYLRASFEEVADRSPGLVESIKPSEADWELGLQALQLLLEPAGVGARDAKECLLIQIDALADRIGEDDRDDEITVSPKAIEIATRLVAEFFDDLMKNKLPKVAAKSGYDLDEINLGIDLLRRLSLSPARRLVAEAPQAVTPDGVVEYDEEEDRYFAYLTDGRLPDVQINKEYARMSADKSVPSADRSFLKKNLSNAQWLIDAVGQRRHTLLRVINAVVDEQRDYFDYGPEALKPLPMKTIADRLGIHVATVSRAVSEKYIMTPRGVVPLRGFFSGGLATDSGEDVSSNSVKATIGELIENEDKAKPMSDEKIVKALKERGIEIARRTVAKYRDQLGIPTARMRKQF
ncbi:MAG: RNA polymerase factor sigma-54 [Phycisphaerales bacterium]